MGRRTTAVLVAVLSALLTVLLVGSLPAAADPGTGGSGDSSSTDTGSNGAAKVTPTTSDEAKKAWLDASDKSEMANEDLLTAQGHEKQAKVAAAAASVAVASANLQVTVAQSAAVQAAAKYDAYRSQLSAFASASFRGARLGQLSVLLTAQSSTDYLDEVASLDQVAGHNRAIMEQALVAKAAADSAATQARTAEQRATDAKVTADAAVATAELATKTVTARKAALDTEVATYHKLFDSLTVQERQAAMDGQQAAWEQQNQEQLKQQALFLAQRQQQAAARQDAPAAGAPAGGAGSDAPASAAGPQAAGVAPSEAGPAAALQATTPRTKAQVAVEAALTRLGYPYVFGASGPGAFDCSGLTSWAWAQAGVSIPRTSAGQARLPYVPLDQLQPGDLVTYYSPVHHVAMYIGNGQIIDAATESKPIYITDVFRGGPNPTGHRVNY